MNYFQYNSGHGTAVLNISPIALLSSPSKNGILGGQAWAAPPQPSFEEHSDGEVTGVPGPPSFSSSSSSIFFQPEAVPSTKSGTLRKKRIQWEAAEDRIVQSMVKAAGTTKPDWNKIADAVNEANLKNRSGKQCRERYVNHLRPNIKKGSWTKDEENMIRYYYETFGPKWSAMAQIMGNRTDNDIKNKWNSMKRSAKIKSKKKALTGIEKMTNPIPQAMVKTESVMSEGSSSSSSSSSSLQGSNPQHRQVLYKEQAYPQYSYDTASTKLQGRNIPTVFSDGGAHSTVGV